jgi:ribonucleoside-diphosphate reductase alpha chain
MSLRHGVSLQFIVTQLLKDKNFVGFEKSVARVLKKYIKSGERVQTSDNCPECKEPSLIYEEGCKRCTSCGWTACE